MRRLLLLAAVCLVTACGAAPRETPAATDAAGQPTSAPLARVTLALNWFPEMEHGGFFEAQRSGGYARAGLDVTLQAGGPGTQVIPQVAQGRVDYGVENADNVVLARARGIPVKALLAPIQRSPRCIIVREDSGITTFGQLADMTLAMNIGNPFAVYLQKTLPLPGVKIVPYAGSVAQFLTEPRFGIQGYSFSEPYIIRQQGGAPRELMLADLGFNPYTSVLIATEATLRERGAEARAMAAASAAGWLAYLENPEPANAVIHAQNPQMGLDVLKFGAETLRPMSITSETQQRGFGLMTRGRWAELIGKMEQVGLIEPGAVRAEEMGTELLKDE